MAELSAKFSLEQKQIKANFSLEQTTIPAVFKINAAGTTWGSISGNIQNQEDLYLILQDKASVESVETLAETVQNNYDTLDTKIDDTESALAGQITALSDTVDINNQNINNRVDNVILDVSNNTNAISTINDTISGYGNIVTHNVDEFATAAQGTLADSALQPGDDISELNNNVGYITSASLPTVNNGSLTIQRNGSEVVVFTANDAQNKTANIIVPTQASDIGALPDTTTIADLTTQAQLDAINSGATATNIGQITTNENAIADIRDLIPIQATSSNQLADKAFVNSSIATNTAYFIGTFNSVAELEAYSGTLTNNDYAFVATTDAAGNTLYDRYKYNADTQQWIFEYELNNSSFTAAQWAAINSGITSGDVSLIQSALQPNDNVSELFNDAGYITAASLPTVNNGTLDIQVNGTSIGTFTANQAGNTTANIVVPDSATWGNITGTLADQTDLQNALDAKQSTISDLSTIRSGAALGATALQPNDNISELVNNVGYITGITVDTTLDNTSPNPVENRVIAQALEEISLAKNPNLNLIGGNLNIDSGNVSGFSTTDYMQFPFIFNFNNYHWTLEMGFITGADVTTQQNLLDSYYGIAFAIRNGKFVLAISSNGSSWDIANTEGTYSVQANTAYSVKITWDGTNYTLSYALDETNYTTDITITSTLVHYSTQEYVGGEPDLYGGSQHPFSGTINLNNWKLTVNGLEVWLGMDDVGLGSRANIDLSNLTEAGQYMIDTVKDQNDGSRIKTWTGTKAEYDAIITKDATTLYNIVDDTDVTLTLLEALYPVGSIYIGTMNVCPLATLGVGTWQLVASDRVLQGAGTRGSVGTTVNESLPNITGKFNATRQGRASSSGTTGDAIYSKNTTTALSAANSGGEDVWYQLDASRSSSTYQDDAPVQQDAYLVNVWERIS